MKTEYYITIQDFCSNHQLEESFVMNLREYELIEVKIIDQQQYIDPEELPKLERMVRLHQELGINPEGIEAVHYLLQKIEKMQREMSKLRNRLQRFEDF